MRANKVLIAVATLPIATFLLATGCSVSVSDSANPGPGGSTTTTTVNGVASEPLSVVAQMVATEVGTANRYLDIADRLERKEYVIGIPISPEDCAAFEKTVSKNYPLHTYTAWSQERGEYPADGVKLCPRDGTSEKVGYSAQSAVVSMFVGSVESSLGVAATRVLTVNYAPSWSSRFPVREQYLLDSVGRVIEMTSTNSLSRDPSEYSKTVATMTPEGHIIGRIYRNLKDMNSAHLWKSASTFVAKDGSISSAMRVRQNDGHGREVTKFSLDIPYQISWSRFDLSPITRIRGIYEIAGKKMDWLKSKLMYSTVTRGTDSCGDGQIGYNAQGGSIREFGDKGCEKSMDVNTTVF